MEGMSVVVVNKGSWLKRYVGLRVFGLFIFLLGFMVYSFFVFASYIEVASHHYSSGIALALSHFKYSILFPGALPLLVAARFLVLFKSPSEFIRGVFTILPLAVFLHYIVAAVAAHESGLSYVFFQLVEFVFVGVVLFMFSRE